MSLKSIKSRKEKEMHFSPAQKEQIAKKVEKEKIKKDTKSKEYTLGCCLYIKKTLCRQQLKLKEEFKSNVFDFATDYIYEKLDVVSYMNLSSNFDRMLLFHFDEIQKLSFNNIKKPNLMNKEEVELFELRLNSFKKDPDQLSELEKENKEKDVKIVMYFLDKLWNNKLDEYDEKLFDFLDEKYKKVIADIHQNS